MEDDDRNGSSAPRAGGPAPAAAPCRRRGLCPPPSCNRPSLKRGDRIPPPVWLRKQNWEEEDFANLLNLKP